MVVRYANTLNAFTSLNLTKLDVLDDLDELRIGVGYKLNGQLLPPGSFPGLLEDLAEVEVVYETMPGWKTPTVGITEFAGLPPKARKYIQRLETLVGVPIAWVGTGPGREQMVRRYKQ